MLSVLLNLDTCSVVSDAENGNRSPGQLAGLWVQVCGTLAPSPNHLNAQVQVKPEVWSIAQQSQLHSHSRLREAPKLSVKTALHCVKRHGRIRWVLTQAIAAYGADLGSSPCWALIECPAPGKIYENITF